MQTLLFDADGVIIDPPHRFVVYLSHELQLPRDSGSRFFEGAFRDCLVGRADLKQAIAPFLTLWGWQRSVDDFLQTWFKEEHSVNGPLVDIVQKLRQKGYFCGIATNQERCRLDYMTKNMGFGELFDGIFGSADVGAVKPTFEFYERVTNRLDVRPEEIIFWDDSEGNVAGARAFGWQAKHFTGVDDFLRTFELHIPM